MSIAIASIPSHTGLYKIVEVYLDSALPFGLRLASIIFMALADGLLRIMINQGIKAVLHYLDDYLLLGDPGTSECADAL